MILLSKSSYQKTVWKVALFLILASCAHATITLPGFFKDWMVLQRDTSVRIWGTGVVGETITVQFAGQTKMDTVRRFADNVIAEFRTDR